jgi:hypothetical protein
MEASRGALNRYAFKGAAHMSGDMIGLVAFDFVLGIVFRSVMHMPLVLEVRGVDGNDCPCHSTRFGIPAYMIANLEHPSHLVDSSFLLPPSAYATSLLLYGHLQRDRRLRAFKTDGLNVYFSPRREHYGSFSCQQTESEGLLEVQFDDRLGMAQVTDRDVLPDI